MKQFVVNFEVVVAFKTLHADRATLKRCFRSSIIDYILILVEPFVDAEVVINMQTGKHSAIITIVQLFKADRATNKIKMN